MAAVGDTRAGGAGFPTEKSWRGGRGRRDSKGKEGWFWGEEGSVPLWWRGSREQGRQRGLRDLGQQGHRIAVQCSLLGASEKVPSSTSAELPHSSFFLYPFCFFFFFLYPLSNIVRTVIFPWCCLHTDTFFFLLIN